MTRAGAFLALGLLVLAGCGADEDVPVDQDGAVDGPVLTSAPSDRDEGDSALIFGTVVLDGDCLLLEQEAGRYAVIWPHGTRWQADPPAVVLSGGEVVGTGGSVTGGGGYRRDTDGLAHGFGDAVAQAAAACVDPTGEVAVFNPGSTVEVG